MKKIFLLLAATVALTACNDENIENDEKVATHFNTTITNSIVTRARDTEWAENDMIGITGSGGDYINIKYTCNSSKKFTGSTIYFKNKREPETFYAYYPYSGIEGTTGGIIEGSTSADNQTTAQQAKIDFLYAKVEDAVAADSPVINLDFAHQMSKVTFKFINGNNGADVSRMTQYQIEGLVLDGTFNTETGECTAKDTEAETLTMACTDVQSNSAMPSILLFPQDLTNKIVTLKIACWDNSKYACEITFDNNKLESGKHYVYTINVHKTMMVIGTSNIVDWDERADFFDATIDR